MGKGDLDVDRLKGLLDAYKALSRLSEQARRIVLRHKFGIDVGIQLYQLEVGGDPNVDVLRGEVDTHCRVERVAHFGHSFVPQNADVEGVRGPLGRLLNHVGHPLDALPELQAKATVLLAPHISVEVFVRVGVSDSARNHISCADQYQTIKYEDIYTPVVEGYWVVKNLEVVKGDHCREGDGPQNEDHYGKHTTAARSSVQLVPG